MPLRRFAWLAFYCTGLAAFGLASFSGADPIHWQNIQTGNLGGLYYGVSAANLPDGRIVLGLQGKVFVQRTWGEWLTIGPNQVFQIANAGGIPFDPSFVAVRDDSTALLGVGGFSNSDILPFNPSSPSSGIGSSLATLQNYSAAYWHSPTSALEGWLIGGTNGPSPTFKHNVTFVPIPIDEDHPVRTLTGDLCSFSSGIAVDPWGNLYTSLYELPGTPDEADADKVLRFTAAQVESAYSSATPVPRSAATIIHKFNGASTIAVDDLGRVWAGGYTFPDVQVYDPATGGERTLVPPHGAINGGQNIYQPARFRRLGVAHIGFLAYDSWLTGGTPVFFVHAPAIDITVPNTLVSWQAFRFGAENLTPANEATLWGAEADPEHDGRPNLVEYACNTLPLSPDGTNSVTQTMNNGLLVISFPRNPLNTDLTYSVEVSNALAANEWAVIASSTGGGATVAIPSGASAVNETAEGTMQRVTVADQFSALGAAPRFMRLRVSLSGP